MVRLLERSLEAGYHPIVWNGTTNEGGELTTGLYIARLETSEYTRIIKMVQLK